MDASTFSVDCLFGNASSAACFEILVQILSSFKYLECILNKREFLLSWDFMKLFREILICVLSL
jgi:hypothetical protein